MLSVNDVCQHNVYVYQPKVLVFLTIGNVLFICRLCNRHRTLCGYRHNWRRSFGQQIGIGCVVFLKLHLKQHVRLYCITEPNN